MLLKNIYLIELTDYWEHKLLKIKQLIHFEVNIEQYNTNLTK